LLDQCDLFFVEVLVRVLVRHAQVRVIGRDAHEQHAVVRLAGDDGERIVLRGEQTAKH